MGSWFDMLRPGETLLLSSAETASLIQNTFKKRQQNPKPSLENTMDHQTTSVFSVIKGFFKP